ncbi:hypothetical protein HYW87_04535, partial [Candidatus Roizmanbacteria bacterium]|nr:hypothetical protein [Candidatus Roizmanbacteria bacterium]
MRHKINLLTKQKKYEEIEKSLQRIKISAVGITILFFLVFLISFIAMLIQKRNLDRLYSEQKSLLEYSLSHKNEEAEFSFLRSKQNQLAGILKKDLNYARYFNSLKESLAVANVGASIESFSVDKDRESTFSLVLSDLNSLLNFVRYTDSQEF